MTGTAIFSYIIMATLFSQTLTFRESYDKELGNLIDMMN